MQPSRSFALTLPRPEKHGYTHWHYVRSFITIAINPFYSLSSVINPTIKLKWLENNWTVDEGEEMDVGCGEYYVILSNFYS
jgi:hypothetical protein